MTVNEFRAWFDGLSSVIDLPNKEQWDLLKEKIDSIDFQIPRLDREYAPRYYAPRYLGEQ